VDQQAEGGALQPKPQGVRLRRLADRGLEEALQAKLGHPCDPTESREAQVAIQIGLNVDEQGT
jgi:hypothetical protein